MALIDFNKLQKTVKGVSESIGGAIKDKPEDKPQETLPQVKEGELTESSVVSKMEITASDGKDYLTFFYSLDAIIAVGYRVSSARATKFRQWATSTLKSRRS